MAALIGFFWHLPRLIIIGWTLLRYDALSVIAEMPMVVPVPAWIIRVLRLVRKRKLAALRPGQRLAQGLVRLGPSFIKFGQVISTRTDILSDQVAADLTDLQDRLKGFDFKIAKERVETELGRSLTDLYQSFDEEPISAASVAQVHFAITPDGREVAVKILRPGVERAFARDLSLFRWMARLLERLVPRTHATGLYQVYAEQLAMETDLRLEAAAAAELRDHFEDDPTFYVPSIDWDRTSRRVLTLERIKGIPIDDKEALTAAGFDLNHVMAIAAQAFFRAVFRDGFFHGDQHAGNMFILHDGVRDGRVCFVDFGIMGRLSWERRCFLADLMLLLLQKQYRKLAERYAKEGYLPPDQDPDAFALALRSVTEPIMEQPLEKVSFAKLLGQLLNMAQTFALEIQPELFLLQKNMLMAEGISRQLTPHLNIWTRARPLSEDGMRQHRGPQARLKEEGTKALETLQRLPSLIEHAERIVRDFDTRSKRSLWPWLGWIIALLFAGGLLWMFLMP